MVIYQANKHPLHLQSSTFCLENENHNMCPVGHVRRGGSSENSETGQREEFQFDLLIRSPNLLERPFGPSSFPQPATPMQVKASRLGVGRGKDCT